MKYKDIKGQRFGRLIAESCIIKLNSNQTKVAFWDCICDCGNRKIIEGTKLRNGHTISCGCYKREIQDVRLRKQRGQPKKYPDECAFNIVYGIYKSNAKIKGFEFNLTKEQFKLITQQNCYYCDSPPDQIHFSKIGNGKYIHHGIDRIDNTKGYILANVLTCCSRDNYLRGNILTVEETKCIVAALVAFRRKDG